MSKRNRLRLLVSFLLLSLLILTITFDILASTGSNHPISAIVPPSNQGPKDGIQRLADDTGGTAQITVSKATGVANFVSLEPGSLPFKLDNLTDRAAGDQALAFLQKYGDAFGIRNPQQELQRTGVRSGYLGARHVNYKQVYQGVPVFAGVLRIHFNPQGQLTAANGTFIPDITLNPKPTLSADEAAAIALAEVIRQQAGVITAPQAKKTTLYVFRANLARNLPGPNHLVYEVEVGNDLNVREFVYVSAHTGKIVDQITGIYHAINRRIYNGGFGPGFLVWQEGSPYPYSGTDATGVNRLIDYAEDTYNLFSSMTNGAFLSWDEVDGIMHSVYNDPAISCPNANWNGVSTNYCTGVDGDDTVGHEWAHAYTESTHNLIYQWQAGALNEAYSDIWGEVIDFLNGAGTDLPGGVRSNGNCSIYGRGSPSVDNSYRWLSGEDDTAFGGAIRDMWTPTCYGDPGKVSDAQFWCATEDGGGVHTNSGIPNHAFALLVDGGVYNGQTISDIGLTKAAHIYWRAQSVYQTPATEFAGHADALAQSCQDLIGAPLYELSTDNFAGDDSGEVISAADCTQLDRAILAVELRTEPTQCNFTTLLNPNAPALCPAPDAPVSISMTDWESGLPAGWVASTRNVANPATFDTPDWAVVGSLPDSRSGQAAFVSNDPSLGNCQADDESGVLYLESPAITIPISATIPRLAFDHWVATEAGWDGGNIKVSVNSGPWTLVPAGAYTFNAYNNSLTIPQNTNPMAGQSAFTGTDGGRVSGSWGQSQVNLSGLASPGDTIRLRFEMGLDGCNGVHGWYVDEVQTYYCPTDTGTDNSLYLPVIMKTDTFGGGNNLVNGNFENGPTGWTEFSSNGFNLILQSGQFPPGVNPRSGSWAVWLGGFPNEISYIQQQVTVPTGSPYLAFWHWIASEDVCGFDFGGVVVNGSTVVEVYNLCASTNTGSWVKRVVNLSSYAGQSISLQIRAETDDVLNSNLFIDDVSFQSSPTLATTAEPKSPLILDLANTKPKPAERAQKGNAPVPQFLLRPNDYKAR